MFNSSDEDDENQFNLIPDTTELKIDHGNRPLWINKNGRIILESFSPVASQAKDLLLAIAEPITRPKHMHEYQISAYSLYAAVSVGIEPTHIIHSLELFSKTVLPVELKDLVYNSTKSFGKVKLVLRDNKFWLESQEMDILKSLLLEKEIMEAKALNDNLSVFNTSEYIGPIDFKAPIKQKVPDHVDLFDDDELFNDVNPDDFLNFDHVMDKDNLYTEHIMTDPTVVDTPLELDTPEIQGKSEIISFEIKKSQVEIVKKKCSELQYPVLEEYDFRADFSNAVLDIDLKPAAKLRPYQEKALSKLFSNGRARSGIIVLPCGAGKTLVGVTAACTIKKSVLVLCNSSLSVEQWSREFKYWSTIKETNLGKFSSEKRQRFEGEAGVLISTYTMVTYGGKRAHDAQLMMDFIQSREWGFLLLDEVHVVPAEMFKKTLTIVSAHSKLGLTATLLREDEKIDTLNWLIGPKLFEANWTELAEDGYIAKVLCSAVWCDMSRPFYREYLRENSRKRQLLYVMNPRKIQACHYLVSLHESLEDKTIVFSDNIFALKHYASILNRPFIYGGTSQSERKRILQQFRFNPALNTIFLSKVGDTSIDLPEANCLIQISSQYGSRRQEAQRLGRILRPKKGCTQEHSAFFYTLVSADTEEMYFASKRQQFLVDQGYEFKIISHIMGIETEDTPYQNMSEVLSLLNKVLLSAEKDEETEDDEDITEELDEDREELIFTRRVGNSLNSISGGTGLTYMETTKN